MASLVNTHQLDSFFSSLAKKKNIFFFLCGKVMHSSQKMCYTCSTVLGALLSHARSQNFFETFPIRKEDNTMAKKKAVAKKRVVKKVKKVVRKPAKKVAKKKR
jgi:hypothetical protein